MKKDYLLKCFDLKDKVAVVIGGGGYLCGAMALALAKCNASITILDKSEKKVEDKVQEIRKLRSKAVGYCFEATKKEQHQDVLEKVLKRFGKVDILINGAGINAPTPVLDIALEEWYAILDSHITATLLGCQVFGAQMVKQKRGSIINMSSASSGPPLSKAFTYSVAKAGIKNLTQNLAREWAPYHVRVNALRPGFFPTQWSREHFITKEREKAILEHTPMGRYGKPEELVGAVIWLASEAASFVTGAEITVDGGFSCMTI